MIKVVLLLLPVHVSGSKQSAGRVPLFEKPPNVLLGENPSFVHHRRNLPIYQYRQEILDQIGNQNVVVITGDAGCGKTTQVPQYIVEKAYENKSPCRIVCVLPRRLSVLAAQDRVTAERGRLLISLFEIMIIKVTFIVRCDWRENSGFQNRLRVTLLNQLPSYILHDRRFLAHSDGQ